MYLQIIKIAEIAVSAMLIIAVLLQTKGAGLSAVFGGEGNVYTVRRGAEKILVYATIVLSVALFGLALSHLFI